MGITIMGVVGMVFMQAQRYIVRFTLVTKAKQQTVQESRTALMVMQKLVQQGQASTFEIDQSTGQPPYSRLYFKMTTAEGTVKEVKIYQLSKILYLDYRDEGAANWNEKVLTSNVRFVSFFYTKTDDSRLLSISLTISQKTAENKETFLQMALQKVRIYNT